MKYHLIGLILIHFSRNILNVIKLVLSGPNFHPTHLVHQLDHYYNNNNPLMQPASLKWKNFQCPIALWYLFGRKLATWKGSAFCSIIFSRHLIYVHNAHWNELWKWVLYSCSAFTARGGGIPWNTVIRNGSPRIRTTISWEYISEFSDSEWSKKPLELGKIDKSLVGEQFVYSLARLRTNELQHTTYYSNGALLHAFFLSAAFAFYFPTRWSSRTFFSSQ